MECPGRREMQLGGGIPVGKMCRAQLARAVKAGLISRAFMEEEVTSKLASSDGAALLAPVLGSIILAVDALAGEKHQVRWRLRAYPTVMDLCFGFQPAMGIVTRGECYDLVHAMLRGCVSRVLASPWRMYCIARAHAARSRVRIFDKTETHGDMEVHAVIPVKPRTRIDDSSRRTALVVESFEPIGTLIQYYLSRCGFACTIARGGVMALAAAERLRPEIIFTGIMMPDMDGYDLLRALQADTFTMDIPVIMTSVLASFEHSFAAGASDHILKPVRREDVESVISAHLECVSKETARGRIALVNSDGTVSIDGECPAVLRTSVAAGLDALHSISGKVDKLVFDCGGADTTALNLLQAARLHPDLCRLKSVAVLGIESDDQIRYIAEAAADETVCLQGGEISSYLARCSGTA